MAFNSVRFGCTSLLGSNKVGTLKKDERGYYKMIVGGLNVFNSAGQLYVYEEAKELFTSSSQLMRRVQRGALRGEYGHPKRLPGMTDRDFAHRCLSVWEERVCCHHKELYLDFDSVKGPDGKPIIAIVSYVCPSGELGHVLEKQLNNPDENVCFSIRSFTDDKIEYGVCKRVLKTVVTFDYVNEPGISYAEKYKSPALEMFSENFTRGDIERALEATNITGAGCESVMLNGDELMTSMGWTYGKGILSEKKPLFTGW